MDIRVEEKEMKHIIKSIVKLGATLLARSGIVEIFVAPRAHYAFVCYKPDGSVRWKDEINNLVTTGGLNDLLTKYFKGASYTAAWFVGLISSASYSAIAAADTMASHAGWTEGVPYSNSVRPTLTLGTAASGSIDNSASKASFTINASLTVKGAFLPSDSTKSGTTGILYSAGLFSGGDRAVQSGDVLEVTVTLSAA
jgi:hypothetical protein